MNSGIPDEADCLDLLARFGQPPRRIAHCLTVGEIAGLLAERLKSKGAAIDPRLARAGGLLHDIAKGRPDHGQAGGDILDGMGYHRLARIARCHVDLCDDTDLDEAALVFLADKMTRGDQIVGLDDRFTTWIEASASKPDVQAILADRHAAAKALKSRIEKLLGQPIEALLLQITTNGKLPPPIQAAHP